MSQDQPPGAATQPAPLTDQRQAAEHPAERSTSEPQAAEPATAPRWDEDPECICAENTLQEPGRGVSRDEPDI